MLSLTLTSLIKAGVLRRMLGAPVMAWRWSFLAAIGASVVVGTLFTLLPKRFEWVGTGGRRAGAGRRVPVRRVALGVQARGPHAVREIARSASPLPA